MFPHFYGSTLETWYILSISSHSFFPHLIRNFRDALEKMVFPYTKGKKVNVLKRKKEITAKPEPFAVSMAKTDKNV